jgi:proteasome lid subunit RPN8/RPN11
METTAIQRPIPRSHVLGFLSRITRCRQKRVDGGEMKTTKKGTTEEVNGGNGASLSPRCSGSSGSASDNVLLDEALRRLRGTEARLSARLSLALRELSQGEEAASNEDPQCALRLAWLVASVRQTIRDIDALVSNNASPLYLMSSLFLEDSYRYLVRDPAEDMHFVTGNELGGVRVLERMLTFEKSTRSCVGVAGDPASTHRTLIALDAKGHRLTAWMHSHPGCGPWATRPSPTDLDHQQRLERGGYPAIGAIFSRDGYLRFFSKATDFRVAIFGKGVTRHDERLYHLD